MNDANARRPVLLFLKAVIKKQVWIPGYTKRNGQVVQGHHTMVNVSTDHDEHKAVAGQGNYTEQQAHKKLSKKDWFKDLPHEHKVAHILKEATAIQTQASMLSRANTLKKKILAGQTPTPGEWKAFDSLPIEKQAQFEAEFKAAGKEEEFGKQWFDYSASKNAEPKPVAAPQAAAEPEHKPAPEPGPEKPAEEPKAAPEPAPKEDGSDAVLAKIEAAKAKLPEGHHITPGQKKKLDAIAHALQTGDAKSILNHGYPTHTYGKQAAKLANEALAALGSKHTVTPGQTMGSHAALKDEGEKKQEPNAAVEQGPKEGDTKQGTDGVLVLKDGHWVKQGEPAAAAHEPPKVVAATEDAKPAEDASAQAAETAGALAMPEFAEGKEKAGVKAYYEKVAQKIIDHAQAGNVAALEGMPTDKGNTWKGKTANSKKLLMLHAIAIMHAKGEAPDAAAEPAGEPGKPAMPSGITEAYQKAAKQVEEWADQGKLEDLAKMATLTMHSGSPDDLHKLKQYAADLYKWKTGEEPKGETPMPASKGNAEELKGYAQSAKASPHAGVPELGVYAEKVADWVEKQQAAAAADDGPKEGDTKQGADGMLIFQNGRWHKQGGDESVAPTGPSAAEAVKKIKLGKMTGKNSVKFKNKAKQLAEIAVKGGAAELDKAIKVTESGGIKVLGFSPILKEDSTQYGDGQPEFVKYAKALHEAVVKGGAVGDENATAAPAQKPKAAPKVTGSTVTTTESVDGWKQVGPQGGFNPGGTYEDHAGQKWYVKFPAGGEKIATKLYAAAGVEVPEVKLVNQGGKIGLASKIIDGAVADKSKLLEGKAKGLLQGFGADAWLANWDAVGNNPAAGKGFDNILFKPDGSAVRIDAGGALLYGGAGGKKQKFENEVTDLQTMLDPAKNANTHAVFGKMSAADIAASVAKVAAIPDHEIEGLVMEFGPGSVSERTRLAEKLLARKYNMIEQYPSAAKQKKGAAAAKVKPNPSALPVDIAALPQPHDFMNWGGTGKPISEKPYVKGNIADEQEIMALAKAGNLTALKAYKFQPVDKLTGEAIGEKQRIDQHPSKYVQDFHNTIVSYLDTIANPPEEIRDFEAKSASTLASLSAAFKPHDFGKTTAMAPKNQQLGFWIALGVADSPAKFAPAAKKLAQAAISQAKAMHAKLPKSVRTFISGVQGSGSYNNPYRDGKETDHSGHKTREVLTDLYNNATAHDGGTTISKWITFAPEMVKQFMDAPEGLVFQNPGSMCTSYDPEATKHFGKDRITIRYAQGAKALDSFASGSFASEMEVTTLPGARFMVLSRKMVADTEHGKSDQKRFELEVLMLPPDPSYVDNLLKKA